MPPKGEEGRAGKPKAPRDIGRQRSNVLTRVVGLEDDAIFRTIVGYL